MKTPFSLTPSKRQGFTLIELLVVIAIIALLAAILFPVFGRARENARRSSCQSNLKQIGLGIAQYNQDFDEKMVPVRNGNNAIWHVLVQPYVTSTQIFKCPSNTTSPGISGYSSTYSSMYLGNGNDGAPGTGFNYRRPMDGTQPTSDATFCGANPTQCATGNYPYKPTLLTEIVNPTQAILVTESEGSTTGASLYSVSSSGGGDFTDHLRTTNILFADGHVKSMKPTSTYSCGSSSCATGQINMFSATGDSANGSLRTHVANREAAMGG